MPRQATTPEQKKFYRELGLVIYSYRIRKCYEQKQVAEHLGVGRSDYSHMERGVIRMKGHHLIELVTFLDIPIEKVPKYEPSGTS